MQQQSTGVIVKQSVTPLSSLTVFWHCSNTLKIMHSNFTVRVLIWAAGRGEQKGVFQDHVQETAAVNTHTHTHTHTQTYRQNHKNTQGLAQTHNTREHTRTAAYTHSYGVWEQRVCKHILTPTHIANLSMFMRAHDIEAEYEMSMCNYMANVVMIWCLNISTVLRFAGTLAIHSQGQARRQRHETHESESVWAQHVS